MDPGFAPITGLAQVMAGFPRPWFVSGGWAIDLFLGRVTRDHGDIEAGIFRDDQEILAHHLAGWQLHKAVPAAEGGGWVPWRAGEWLALPIHQLLILPSATMPPGTPEYEFFLNDAPAGRWQFRRDPTLTRPRDPIVARGAFGIPIITPEIQLLYKAQRHAAKDEHDFDGALPRLSPKQRAWLRAALHHAHPGHPWIARIDPAAGVTAK